MVSRSVLGSRTMRGGESTLSSPERWGLGYLFRLNFSFLVSKLTRFDSPTYTGSIASFRLQIHLSPRTSFASCFLLFFNRSLANLTSTSTNDCAKKKVQKYADMFFLVSFLSEHFLFSLFYWVLYSNKNLKNTYSVFNFSFLASVPPHDGGTYFRYLQ